MLKINLKYNLINGEIKRFLLLDDVIEQFPPLMIGDKFEKGLDLDTYKKWSDGYGDRVSIVVGPNVISMFVTMIFRVQCTASFSFFKPSIML